MLKQGPDDAPRFRQYQRFPPINIEHVTLALQGSTAADNTRKIADKKFLQHELADCVDVLKLLANNAIT